MEWLNQSELYSAPSRKQQQQRLKRMACNCFWKWDKEAQIADCEETYSKTTTAKLLRWPLEMVWPHKSIAITSHPPNGPREKRAERMMYGCPEASGDHRPVWLGDPQTLTQYSDWSIKIYCVLQKQAGVPYPELKEEPWAQRRRGRFTLSPSIVWQMMARIMISYT